MVTVMALSVLGCAIQKQELVNVSSPDIPAIQPPKGWYCYSTNALPDGACGCAALSPMRVQVSMQGSAVKAAVGDAGQEQQLAQAYSLVPKDAVSEPASRAQVRQCDDGFLVAFDAGEWGASLWWVSRDHSFRVKLSDDHVVGFLEVGRRLVVLTGFDHLIDQGGHAYLLSTKPNERPGLKEVTGFTNMPHSYATEQQASFLVATSRELVRVSMKGEQKVLHVFSCRITSNSMVLDESGGVYLGAQLVILHLALKGQQFEERWYLPGNCHEPRVVHEKAQGGYVVIGCSCRG